MSVGFNHTLYMSQSPGRKQMAYSNGGIGLNGIKGLWTTDNSVISVKEDCQGQVTSSRETTTSKPQRNKGASGYWNWKRVCSGRRGLC